MAEVALVSGLLSISSSVESSKAQKQSIEEQRAQNRLQQRKTDIRNARERVNLVRRARIAQAQVVAAAENTGGAGGSGAAGGIASIGSQVAGNIGFVNRVGSIDASISASKDREGAALSKAATAQAIGGLADSIFSTSISRT